MDHKSDCLQYVCTCKSSLPQKTYHPETLRKIKKGLLIICECGTTHSGRYEKCSQCLKRTCTNCRKPYRKGTDKLCSSCNKKRLKKAESGII